jgi:flagellar biosynthesis GTPase FlhF
MESGVLLAASEGEELLPLGQQESGGTEPVKEPTVEETAEKSDVNAATTKEPDTAVVEESDATTKEPDAAVVEDGDTDEVRVNFGAEDALSERDEDSGDDAIEEDGDITQRAATEESSANATGDGYAKTAESQTRRSSGGLVSSITFHDLGYEVGQRRCFKKLPNKIILDSVSGEMRAGVNAIMGPTGSGKTT